MTDPDLRQELRRLSDRLERLERVLDIEAIDPGGHPAPLRAPVPTPAAPPLAPAVASPPPVTTSDRPTPTEEPSGAAPVEEWRPPRAKAAALTRVTSSTVPSLGGAGAPRSTSSEPRSVPVRDRISLELLIGGRWAAWVGALTIVVGAAVSIKIAYDKHWFRVLSLPLRCAICAAFGLAMLGLGEVALRKISRAASVGLFGAGLGTLYVTTLVSFRLEVLGSAGLTLALLAVVACIGIAVAVRAALLSIGVISIIAGYAAPLLVPDAGAFRAALPSYLTMMLLIGLALSAWRPRPFRTLRIVTFGAHAILATFWILSVGSSGGILELTFMSGWWMMVTGEVVYAAIRRQSSRGNPIISLLATAWFALFGCVLLNTTTALPFGMAGGFAAGVGVVAGAIAMQFGPGLDALRRLPQNAMEKLAASLWVQAGCLIVVAAALQFSDYGTTIAWLAIGLAAIEVGRRIPSIATERFGLVVGTLGMLRLLSIDLFQGIGVTALTVGSISISQWGLLALGGMAVLHLAAWRLRPTGAWARRYTPMALLIISAALWLLATQVELYDHGLLATAAWLGGAAVMVVIGAMVIRLPYLQIGACMTALAVLRLLSVDLFLVAPATAFALGSISISQWGLLALSGIAVLHFAAWMLRRTGEFPITQAPSVLVVLSAILWLRATHVDLDGLLITVAWLLGAVVLVALGAVVRKLPYRHVGGALIACTALRWVGVDMLATRAQSFEEWIAATPVLNTGVLVGLLIIASGGLLLWADRRANRERHITNSELMLPVLYGMGLLLMILVSFEVDRAVAIYEHAQGEALRERWAPGQLLSLWLTLLWGLTGVATAVLGASQRRSMVFSVGAWAAALCSGVWLAWDTLYYRFAAPIGHASVVFNLQFFVGLMLAISLALGVRLMGYRRAGTRLVNSVDPNGDFINVALALVAIIGLWLGSLEIDRLFNPDTSRMVNAAMARQTGLSIYWGLFGIALVTIGFLWRVAESRYAGLALLAITLLKVVVVDMGDVESIYRVMSLVGVGLLLVLTSIGYAKMSSRLLGTGGPDTTADQGSSESRRSTGAAQLAQLDLEK